MNYSRDRSSRGWNSSSPEHRLSIPPSTMAPRRDTVRGLARHGHGRLHRIDMELGRNCCRQNAGRYSYVLREIKDEEEETRPN